jgi:hypothetical protein
VLAKLIKLGVRSEKGLRLDLFAKLIKLGVRSEKGLRLDLFEGT